MKLTPEFLRKIGKGAKDLMLKTIKAAKQATKTNKSATDTLQKAEIAVSKIPVGKIAKAVVTAELGDELAKSVFSMPIVSQAYSLAQKVEDFRIEAQKATFFKIPIIGPLLQKASKGVHQFVGNVATVLGLETVADAAYHQAEQINDKNWYLNLGEHVPFSIPIGYPDSYPTKLHFGSTGRWPRNKIVVISGDLNYAAQPEKVRQRMSQLFVLLKGIRGLSQVSYTITDIFNYQRSVLTLATRYFNLCKMIRIAKLYNVMKSDWPDEVLTAIHAPTDIESNLAAYENLAFQWKQALSQLPIFGTIYDKIKYLCLAFLADSNDSLIATFYTYDIYSQAFDPHGPSFGSYIGRNNTASSISTSFNSLHKFIMENETYGAIMGDMIGAFGTYAMKDFSVDLKPYDLKSCYNELGLSMIQNAYSTKLTCSVRSPDGTILNMGDPSSSIGYLFEAGGVQWQPDNYNILSQNTVYVRSIVSATNTFEPGAADAYIVPHQGMKGYTFKFKSTNETREVSELIDENAQIVINTNKYKLDEGESLELLQTTGYVDKIRYRVKHETAPNEDDANYDIELYSKTGLLAITGITASNYPQGMVPIDYMLSVPTATNVDKVTTALTLWSQADWAPKLVFRIVARDSSGNETIGGSTMWDSNVFGYMTKETVDIGIGYSIYSIYAPNVKAAGKTIDNIRDLYNNM